jgi:hypothetical protein
MKIGCYLMENPVGMIIIALSVLDSYLYHNLKNAGLVLVVLVDIDRDLGEVPEPTRTGPKAVCSDHDSTLSIGQSCGDLGKC